MTLRLFALMIGLMTANLTGTWNVVLESPAYQTSSPSTFVLTQKGDNFIGTYEGRAGKGQVKGTLSGNAITMTVEAGGRKFTFKGQLNESGGSIKGEYEVAGGGNGTFAASKVEPTNGSLKR